MQGQRLDHFTSVSGQQHHLTPTVLQEAAGAYLDPIPHPCLACRPSALSAVSVQLHTPGILQEAHSCSQRTYLRHLR